MKVGIIRCMQTEDFCPGTTDFRMIREKKGAFEGVEEDIEIIHRVYQLRRLSRKKGRIKGEGIGE